MKIGGVTFEFSFGEYLVLGIRNFLCVNSAIRVVLVVSCVARLYRVIVLREDIVFVDEIEAGDFIGS
jgi:hypothetical protein